VIATGSELHLAVQAATELAEQNIAVRIVSAPCLEWFDEQDDAYKSSLLTGAPKIAIEAGSAVGWYKYVGSDGKVLSVDHFGASAAPTYLFEKFGITTANLVKQIKALI
jgi:transketolase